MDFQIADRQRKRRVRRLMLAGGGAAALLIVVLLLGSIAPGAPEVDRSVVWTGVVERGELVRQVRGPGSLQVPPEQIRWLAAETRGRVEERRVLPGTPVEEDTVLLVLSNPELEQQTREAELQLRAEEAELRRLLDQTRSDLLEQQKRRGPTRRFLGPGAPPRRRGPEALRGGAGRGTDPPPEPGERRGNWRPATPSKKSASAILADSSEAQVASKEATVARYRAVLELRRRQLAALTVRAGRAGTLLEVPVEVGQEVSPGANLARVADPRELKAVLRIAETQARDVEPGQPALVDTRNGVVEGVVSRVDPAVREGTVAVDIAIAGELPRGARPDLSVDGTIELDRIPDTLHVGRPAYGQPGSTVGLFRIAPDGETAERVPVELGRGSVNRIEVLAGLAEGDEIILSDTSAWDSWDRIRLR